MVCRDFILPEPASYVFFYAFSNLRKLLYIIPHNTTVAKRFATFRYYCLMCVYARLGLTVTDKAHQRCKVTSNHRMLICVACRNGDVSAKLCMKSLEEVFPCFMKIFGWSERNGAFRRRNWHHAFMLSDRPFQNGKKEFPIVKDTTPNMMNPRLYTTSYNKP